MGDIRGGSRRARMILQHKVDWVRDDTFLDTFKKVQSDDPVEDTVVSRLRGMRDRLLAMAESVDGQRVGYSQQG